MLTSFKTQALSGALTFLSDPNSLYPPEYKAAFDELEALYKDKNKLPGKIGLSEADNMTYDMNRVDYINKALQFLQQYYTPGNQFLKRKLSKDETVFFEGIQLLNARRLLDHIAYTVYHLSGTIRRNYKKLLSPAPFTWDTFEQLGGLMKTSAEIWNPILIRNVPGVVAKRLVDELYTVELIVEAAVPTLIVKDIPALIQLFAHIKRKETNPLDITPDPIIKLIAIKALTRRLTDAACLTELLKFSDNLCTTLDHSEIIKKVKAKIQDDPRKQDQLYCVQIEDSDKKYQRPINLNTKLGLHAALRRLEMIGELITGKNTSSFLTNLDPSIDWDAFITIRDTIAHQDEPGNKKKLEQFMQDPTQLMAVLQDDMNEFFFRLCQVVALRDTALPKFLGNNIEGFWSAVYSHEEQALNKLSEENRTSQSTIKPRASKDDVKFIMQALKDNHASQEIQLEWLGILNGRQPLPNKETYGRRLLPALPSKKDNRALYDQCKAIIDKAIHPKSEQADREQATKDSQELAKQRAAAREQKLSGLGNIRGLAKTFCAPNPIASGLTHVERIEAAISALENIKEFMEQEPFVKANFNFPSVQDWSKTQTPNDAMNFFARLKTNPEFNDAIEYNAAQLLQHLERIKSLPQAKGCRFLNESYDDLRYLRNYVEHGNALLNTEEYEPGKNPSILSDRQQKVGPIMITLIFELLPKLKSMKSELKSDSLFSGVKLKANSNPADSTLRADNQETTANKFDPKSMATGT